MKTTVRTLLLVGLLATSALAHADKTVTFNIPVKLEKLDPAVKSAFMYCAIQGTNALSIIEHGPSMIINNGGFVGINSVAGTVKDADMGRVKTWTCYLRVKKDLVAGGGGSFGLNVAGEPWTAAAASSVPSASGNF